MKQAFEQVVAQHGLTVLRVCRAVLGSHDAEDAWSETFIAAMRAYPDLPPDVNVEAWLVTIAHRKAIDVVRAAKRRPVPVDDLTRAEDQDSLTTGPTNSPDSVPEQLDLWATVRRLPNKQRQAVAYHYVAGLPYAEIAEIVGGSADAARRAEADGINNLRKNHPGTTTEGADS